MTFFPTAGGIAGQMLPQGMNGIGAALGVASPLLLAMSAGLRSGDGAMSQMPMGLLMMQQQQKLKREEEAKTAAAGAYGSWNAVGGASGLPAAMGASNTPTPPSGPLAGAMASPERFSSSPSMARGAAGQLFAGIEQNHRLPPGYLDKTWEIESSRGKNMQSPLSSAGGHFAFIDSTAAQYGVNRGDLASEAEGAARIAADARSALVPVLGREPTAGEFYLAHQQGAAGAAGLLANPNARAADIVGARAVSNNGGDPATMTAGDFAQRWISKFGPAQPANPAQDPQVRGMIDWLAQHGAADPARASAVEMQLQMRVQQLQAQSEGQGITDMQAAQLGLQEAGQQPAPPGPPDPFTLAAGQNRYDGYGNLIASGGEEPVVPLSPEGKAEADRKAGLLPTTTPYDFGAEESLRKEYSGLKPVADFQVQASAIGRIAAAAADPSPAGDIALIFSYMKMLDPTSAVREREYATAESAGSIPTRIWGQYNKVLSGESLAPAQRADFMREAKAIYDAAKGQHDKLTGRYRTIAERRKLDPDNAIPDYSFTGEFPDPLAPPPPVSGAADPTAPMPSWMTGDPRLWTPEQKAAFDAYFTEQMGGP
jgi:hypothetical protein